jgi:hypothetical protein
MSTGTTQGVADHQMRVDTVSSRPQKGPDSRRQPGDGHDRRLAGRLLWSGAVCDQASQRDGTTHAVAPRSQGPIGERQPAKLTFFANPSAAARVHSLTASSPVPRTIAAGGSESSAIASSRRSGPFSGWSLPAKTNLGAGRSGRASRAGGSIAERASSSRAAGSPWASTCARGRAVGEECVHALQRSAHLLAQRRARPAERVVLAGRAAPPRGSPGSLPTSRRTCGRGRAARQRGADKASRRTIASTRTAGPMPGPTPRPRPPPRGTAAPHEASPRPRGCASGSRGRAGRG